MRTLLHVCCALCYAKALPGAAAAGLTGGAAGGSAGGANELAAFWFNPNIHPLIEYRRRLKAVQVFSERVSHELVVRDAYELAAFCRLTVDAQQRPERCRVCYDWRLRETARAAREGGFDAFATTLCTSTHQDHGQIRAAGEQAAREFGIGFLYNDWRTCEPEERLLKGIYRQQYCGCVFSEQERYEHTSLHLYRNDSSPDQ